ncbi:hypothetical protein SAMN06264364_101323 [Quadrisphaera granulorum]|uniref:Uncharacterized protein n=1 Tax=Quadrisphaera granulorum TaxID=317664 RepID=A0A316B1D6_9ACTN|nr:hypothetical protein [Quadrisphaera granulorum]PWJ56347.1 hypothetical protein BXY45_101323 [Quadrisphaera granulorum]SZE94981.1 hypothetical protein SAMN06264364_101323 [Quadrisphaera granulorum]
MSLTDRPAPARTDVSGADTSAATSSRVPAQRTRRQHEPLADPPTASWVRRRAAVLVAGGLAWSLTTYAVGLNTPAGELPGRIADLSSFCFQAGVMALLTIIHRTQALGPGRVARGFLRVEAVLLGLAMVNSLLAATVADMGNPVQFWTDPFWPLSMLGMLVCGVRIAVAGRWQGVLRFYPSIAEAYFPLVMGSILLFGRDAADIASGTVVLLGYTGMGVVIAARPDLVGARG